MKLQKSSENAKHAFWYLTSFFTLTMSSIGIGMLLFQIVDYFFSNDLQNWYYYNFQEMLKTGISFASITAPIFFFSTRYINRSLSRKDLDEDSALRKWLTYFILFGTVVVSIVTLVTLLRSLLDGDYTITFLLKVAVVFILSGTIFLYYFTDMKNKSEKSRLQKNKIWTYIFLVLILAPLTWSVFMIESPSKARARQKDEQLSQEIINMKYAVESYYVDHQALPESKDVFEGGKYYFPNSKYLKEQNLEYKKLEAEKYALCANFETNTKQNPRTAYTPYYGAEENGAWIHEAGNTCVSFAISEQVRATPPPIKVPSEF
ncbi:hypothetical protein HZA38_02575 [Candidatus Peregrinibacteria bacterium]|nr:hypothetical protein [Candidatus Peregrinibacteria bacterium]